MNCVYNVFRGHVPVISTNKTYVIGVGTRGGRPGPPQYFTLETLLIFMHAAQIAAIAKYKMEFLPTPMYVGYAL